MPDRFIDPVAGVLLLLVIIIGGFGGATVASVHVLRGRRMRMAKSFAYMSVGGAFALGAYLFAPSLGLSRSADGFLGHLLLISVAGVVLVVSRDFGLRWTLERFGWRMEVEVFRNDRRNDETTAASRDTGKTEKD